MNQHDANPERRPGGVLGARTVFSDYAAMLGARVGSALLSVVSVLITARLLAPADFGVVAYFVLVAFLVFTVSFAWTSPAVARFGREEIETGISLAQLTWSRIAICAPLFALAIAGVVLLEALGAFPDEFGWALVALAIGYGAGLVIADHLQYSLIAAGQIKRGAAWNIGQQIAIVATFAAVYLADLDVGPLEIAAIMTGWSAVFGVALSAACWRLALWPPARRGELARKLMRFSLPLVALIFAQYLIRSVDLFVLGIFAGATTIGVYAIAYQAYSVLQQLTIATGPVLTPLFVSLRSAGREQSVSRYYERVVPQLTLIAAVIAAALLAPVAAAVPVILGDPFADAATPLVILMCAIVVVFAAELTAPILILHEGTKAIGAINVVAAVVNVALDFILIGVFDLGLVGPAIATVAAVAVIRIGYDVVVRERTRTRPQVAMWAAFAPLAAAGVPALVLTGAVAIGVSLAAAVAAGALVVALTRPFAQADAELIAALDMPPAMKRAALKSLRVLGR